MNQELYLFLIECVFQIPQHPYPVQSRVHKLRSFENSYVKRDDELGFGITGSKIRKFRSLIPAILKKSLSAAVLIGGANSNNLVGLTQLLIENGIEPYLVLRGKSPDSCVGNHLLLRLLLQKDAFHFVDRNKWETAAFVAKELCDSLNKAGKCTMVIPEGSCLREALPGVLSLPLDVIRNETAQGFVFESLFIDAGTAMTAAALLLAFAWMKRKTHVYVVLLAGTAETFHESLKCFHDYFKAFLGRDAPFPENYTLLRSETAPSFGSVNKRVLSEIQTLARVEGFFVDPVYSAKLFLTARSVIQTKPFKGPSLIIHSGGELSLSGFQHQLQEMCV